MREVDRRHPQSRGRPPAGCERVEPARAAMTTRPRTEDLTLPEPARTLLSRTRAILDRLRHAANAGRSGWIIGGGTILAARWRHRESRDIDLLVHPRTETRFPATGGPRRNCTAGLKPPAPGRSASVVSARSSSPNRRSRRSAAEPQPRIRRRIAAARRHAAGSVQRSALPFGRVSQAGSDIVAAQLGELRQKLILGSAAGQVLEYVTDCDPRTSNARLAEPDGRVNRDPIKAPHGSSVRQSDFAGNPGGYFRPQPNVLYLTARSSAPSARSKRFGRRGGLDVAAPLA